VLSVALVILFVMRVMQRRMKKTIMLKADATP